MRLYPAVTEEEALEWLQKEALSRWGPELEPQLDSALKTLAQAMAAISAIELPEEVEPLLL